MLNLLTQLSGAGPQPEKGSPKSLKTRRVSELRSLLRHIKHMVADEKRETLSASQMSRGTLLSLPNETLDQIVSDFVSPPELGWYKSSDTEYDDIQNIRLTCRKLAAIGLKYLFCSLDLGPTSLYWHVDRPSTRRQVKILEQNPYLVLRTRELVLHHDGKEPPILNRFPWLLSLFPSVTHLSLAGLCPKELLATANAPSVRHLVFELEISQDKPDPDIRPLISLFPNLEELRIRLDHLASRGINPDRVLEGLENLPRLRLLQLGFLEDDEAWYVSDDFVPEDSLWNPFWHLFNKVPDHIHPEPESERFTLSEVHCEKCVDWLRESDARHHSLVKALKSLFPLLSEVTIRRCARKNDLWSAGHQWESYDGSERDDDTRWSVSLADDRDVIINEINRERKFWGDIRP